MGLQRQGFKPMYVPPDCEVGGVRLTDFKMLAGSLRYNRIVYKAQRQVLNGRHTETETVVVKVGARDQIEKEVGVSQATQGCIALTQLFSCVWFARKCVRPTYSLLLNASIEHGCMQVTLLQRHSDEVVLPKVLGAGQLPQAIPGSELTYCYISSPYGTHLEENMGAGPLLLAMQQAAEGLDRLSRNPGTGKVTITTLGNVEALADIPKLKKGRSPAKKGMQAAGRQVLHVAYTAYHHISKHVKARIGSRQAGSNAMAVDVRGSPASEKGLLHR
jgi:hypothetical protein